MSKAATSIFVYGIYLIVLGLGFLILPNVLLPLFGLPTTGEVWIRVVAMLLLILAYYYIRTARHEVIFFFRLTVHGRLVVILFAIAFVLLGFGSPSLILLGAVDFVAALWTAWALRADSQP